MKGLCALCDKESELQISHIIPKFVFNWFKDSVPSAVRSVEEPNLRIQDGIKLPFLCSACEGLFNKWETTFYNEFFSPIHESSNLTQSIRYSSWALKFSVSVSWRVLNYYFLIDDVAHFSDAQLILAHKASDTWKNFLLGKSENPAQFEQHLILVDVIQSHPNLTISPFLNRYLLRSTQMTPICSKNTAMVYTKMGHIILFGLIQFEHLNRWRGTKIHVNNGSYTFGNKTIPYSIHGYLNEQADKMAESLASISPKQKKIINRSIMNNADELANSELFRAMQYDVYNSGDAAFSE